MKDVFQFLILDESDFGEQAAMDLFALSLSDMHTAKSLIYFPKSATVQFPCGGCDRNPTSSLLKDLALLDLLKVECQCNDESKVKIFKNRKDFNVIEDTVGVPE